MTTATATQTTIAASVNTLVDEAMTTRKGVNVRLSWKRNCKVKKTCQDLIEKATVAVGRLGIDYNNQASVIEKRENGELPEEAQPIWGGKGAWVIFPYLFRHTVTNKLYMRLYNGTSKTAKPTVQFYRNGDPVSKSELETVLLASEKKTSDPTDCFCVKLDDITMIGKIGEEAIEKELQTA